MAIGLENNPTLSKNYALLQAREWKLIASQRAWYPQISITNLQSPSYTWTSFIRDEYGNAGEFYSQNPKPNSKARADRSQNRASSGQRFIFNPNIKVAWRFLDPSRQPSINAQEASLRQQQYIFLSSARSLILEIQKSYFRVQSTAQLISSFQKIYTNNRIELETIEARKEIGMATVLEVEQIRSQLFTNLSQLIGYTRNYITETAELSELIALSPDAIAIPSEPAAPFGAWSKPLEDTIVEAISQREELLAALAQAESSKWLGVSEMRRYLPVFSLAGNGSLTGTNGYQEVPLSNDPGTSYQASRNWSTSIAIEFEWQLFDGGIKAANAQSSFANSRGYLADKTIKENEVIRQVRASYGQLLTAKVAIESSRQGYQSAQLAEQAAKARYEVGVENITTVVQATARVSQTSVQLADSILNHNNAIADLYRYTSTWPSDTKGKVDQRLMNMREEGNQ
nr:TolC family protein [Synechococcus sp. UW105]